MGVETPMFKSVLKPFIVLTLLVGAASCHSPVKEIKQGSATIDKLATEALINQKALKGHVEPSYEKVRSSVESDLANIKSVNQTKIADNTDSIKDTAGFLERAWNLIKTTVFWLLLIAVVFTLANFGVFPFIGAVIRWLTSVGISFIPKTKDDAVLMHRLKVAADASGDPELKDRTNSVLAVKLMSPNFAGTYDRVKKLEAKRKKQDQQ